MYKKKYYILHEIDNKTLLNKKSELINKCRNKLIYTLEKCAKPTAVVKDKNISKELIIVKENVSPDYIDPREAYLCGPRGKNTRVDRMYHEHGCRPLRHTSKMKYITKHSIYLNTKILVILIQLQ